MSDDSLRNATRRFRRRVATGRPGQRYLTPELREDAERLQADIEQLLARTEDDKITRRVQRMREGATVEQSRHKNWRQRSLFDEDDD